MSSDYWAYDAKAGLFRCRHPGCDYAHAHPGAVQLHFAQKHGDGGARGGAKRRRPAEAAPAADPAPAKPMKAPAKRQAGKRRKGDGRMAMVCRNCNRVIEEETPFCPKCGVPLGAPPARQVDAGACECGGRLRLLRRSGAEAAAHEAGYRLICDECESLYE